MRRIRRGEGNSSRYQLLNHGAFWRNGTIVAKRDFSPIAIVRALVITVELWATCGKSVLSAQESWGPNSATNKLPVMILSRTFG